jgi:transposase-like protein
VVADEVETWRNRPVDEVYPILYIDGIRIRVRDKGAVTVKTAHLAVGVDVDVEGRKHALGLWIAEAEGAKFWHSVLTQLRNRGLRDILIACCDGLTGLPEAITAVFPDTIVQTCVVHVIRNAMRFVSYSDQKEIAAGMRSIYNASSLEAGCLGVHHRWCAPAVAPGSSACYFSPAGHLVKRLSVPVTGSVNLGTGPGCRYRSRHRARGQRVRTRLGRVLSLRQLDPHI